MSNSGYPTPDMPLGDIEYICIPLIVPNIPEFQAAIYGLYGTMAKEYFWREFGTMTPEFAAQLASNGLGQTNAYGECGGTMACEDVADCVEQEIIINNELRQSFFEFTTQSGFSDPNRVFSAGTTVKDRNIPQALAEPVYEMSECNLDALWGGIRYGIVARLDDNARQALEALASISDVPERIQVFLDIVPVVGDLAEALLTQLTEAVPDILNLYEAHSSIEALDEIACEIFSLVCSECRYPTFEELYQYYWSYGTSGMPTLYDAVMDVMAELVSLSVNTIAKVTYFTLQTWQLYVLGLQATFNGTSGTATITRYAQLGIVEENDNWKILCETCNEPYAYIVWDYTTGQNNSARTSGFASGNMGTYMTGKGWRLDQINGGGSLLTIAQPIDPDWVILALAYELTDDAPVGYVRSVQLRPNPGVPNGATTVNMSNGTGDYNNCKDAIVAATNFQEIALRLSAAQTPVQYLKRLKIVISATTAPAYAIQTTDVITCD